MQQRTRIKICGITRAQDALFAAACGVDSIGLNFHPPSPRMIDIDAALAIRDALPPFVGITALFLDDSEDWITQVAHRLRPDYIQFHGSESAEFCEAWGIPYLKTIPMGSTDDALAYAGRYPTAQGFLLDSNAAGRLGGSGDTFDWSRIPSINRPLLLAGGLSPANVAEAVRQVRPWGVDVASGVEASAGVKDSELVEAFFREVRRGDGDDG